MKTSTKLRILQRRRKLRRQRTAFLMVVLVILLMIANAAFSKPEGISDEYTVVSVRVQPGDTLCLLRGSTSLMGQTSENLYTR